MNEQIQRYMVREIDLHPASSTTLKESRVGPRKEVVLYTDHQQSRAADRAELDRWKRMHRDNLSAFDAMRNDLNEVVGDMESPEASLRNGPELAAECADIVVAVNNRVEADRARIAELERAYTEGRQHLDEALAQLPHEPRNSGDTPHTGGQ